MRSSLFPFTLIAIALFGGGILNASPLESQQPDARATGYTIQRIQRATYADGKSSSSVLRVAINDAGSVRFSVMGKDGKDETYFTIFSPLTRSDTEFRPQIKAKTTVYHRDTPIASPSGKNCAELRHPPRDPETEFTDLGESTFLGWRVIKTATKWSKIEKEVWISPDCNCEELYSRQVQRNSDTQAFENMLEVMATSITLGNPDPSLFQEPPGYSEMSPSQARITEYGPDYFAKLSESAKRSIEYKDMQYYESQKLKPKEKP